MTPNPAPTPQRRRSLSPSSPSQTRRAPGRDEGGEIPPASCLCRYDPETEPAPRTNPPAQLEPLHARQPWLDWASLIIILSPLPPPTPPRSRSTAEPPDPFPKRAIGPGPSPSPAAAEAGAGAGRPARLESELAEPQAAGRASTREDPNREMNRSRLHPEQLALPIEASGPRHAPPDRGRKADPSALTRCPPPGGRSRRRRPAGRRRRRGR